MDAKFLNDGSEMFYLMNFPEAPKPLAIAEAADLSVPANPSQDTDTKSQSGNFFLGMLIVIAGGIVLHYLYSAAIRAREEKDSSHTN